LLFDLQGDVNRFAGTDVESELGGLLPRDSSSVKLKLSEEKGFVSAKET